MSASAVFQSKVGVEILSKRSGLQVGDIRKLFETVVVLLEEGREVDVGFGKFQPRIQQPRIVHSPIITQVSLKTRRKVIFKMSASLRKRWILESRVNSA